MLKKEERSIVIFSPYRPQIFFLLEFGAINHQIGLSWGMGSSSFKSKWQWKILALVNCHHKLMKIRRKKNTF